MADEKQPSWKKEVGSAKSEREAQRQAFYEKVAQLRLQVDPQNILDDPASQGLKAQEELRGLPTFSKKVQKGDSLSKYLREYFSKNAEVKDRKTRNKEVALSLFYLSQQKDAQGKNINVDRLIVGWEVKIENGVITMTNDKGETVLEANLRKPLVGPPEAADTKPTDEARSELADLGSDIGAAKAIEISETLPEMPRVIYKYKRSKYSPEEQNQLNAAREAIRKRYEKADPTEEFVVTLTGTADKATFKIDRTSRKKRVDLKRGDTWRADFKRALEALKSNGQTELAALDFTANDIEAIHELTYEQQQTVMNHAIAWLRAERLQNDLAQEFPGKNVRFKIDTKWIQDPYTRVATVIDLKYKEAPPKDEKPTDKVLPRREADDEDGKPRRPEEKMPPKPPVVAPPPKPPVVAPPPKPPVVAPPLKPPVVAPPPKPPVVAPPPKPPVVAPPPKPPVVAPPPKPPEKPPYKPDEIVKIIEALDNGKYKLAKEATLEHTGPSLFTHTDTWEAPQRRNAAGELLQVYFVIDKGNPNNPKHYVFVNVDNPTAIGIGKIDYNPGWLRLQQKGKFLPTSDVLPIDNSTQDKAKASIDTIFSKLP